MKLLYLHAKNLRIDAGVSGRHPHERKRNEAVLRNRLGDALPLLDDSSRRTDAKNALLALVTVEKDDAVLDLAKVSCDILHARALLGVQEIVLGAFAHLGGNAAEADVARRIMDDLARAVKTDFPALKTFPFGWDKSLEISVPLHHYNIAYRDFKPLGTWDELADDYHMYMLRTGHYEAQYHLLDSLQFYISGTVLELGCGAGEVLKYLRAAQLFRKRVNEYVGLDTSERMISLAKQNNAVYQATGKANPPARLGHAGIEAVDGGCCYTVIMMNTVAYVDLEFTLDHINRVLVTNGHLIVGEEDPFVPGFMEKCATRMRLQLEGVQRRSIDELVRLIAAKFFHVHTGRVQIDKDHDLVGLVFVKV